jgi:dolichol-phosphate mannosyltransferase
MPVTTPSIGSGMGARNLPPGGVDVIAPIVVVIPTYNEAQNLEAIVAAVLGLGVADLQVLIVDDNSPDGTGDIADRLALQWNAGLDAGERARVQVLHRQGKGGLGTAYIAGMNLALAEGAAYVVQMDADFSHSPEYIPRMLGVMDSLDADVVIGSRYVPGGSLDERWSWWRRFVSWWANLYSRAILGLRIRDMTAGFKLWRRGALEAIGLENIKSNGYSFQVEMAYLSERLGFRIVEIPIHFEDRRIGQSKLDIPVKIESAWRTWQIRWQYRSLPRKRAELSMAPVPASPVGAPSSSHIDSPVPGKTS